MFAEPFWIWEAVLENTILTGLSGDQKAFCVQVGSRTQKRSQQPIQAVGANLLDTLVT